MASSPEVVEQRRERMAHARNTRLVQQRTKKRAEHIEWIKSTSYTLPPLTDEQCEILTALLASGGVK